MANHYTQYSQVVENLTDAEIEWLEFRIKGQEEIPEDMQEAFGFFLDEADKEGAEVDYWPDFDAGIDKEHRYIKFYAEEDGNYANISILMMLFLRKFRPNDYFELSFASYCSVLRPMEFLGGAMFVTANGYEMESSFDWLYEKREAFKAQKKKNDLISDAAKAEETIDYAELEEASWGGPKKNPVCPYCYTVEPLWQEFGLVHDNDETKISCGKCGEMYEACLHLTRDFSSRRIS